MLLSIDPGINNCGLAVIDHTNVFTVLETMNVCNTRRFTDEEKVAEKVFGTRSVKVLWIMHQVSQMLAKYPQITHVAIEAPFYSPLTPAAYGSLLEIISAIRYSILIPANIMHSLVEPLLVKRMFINVKLGKDLKKKEAMRMFLVTKVCNGEIVLPCSVDALSEHEIDAIAVGFSRAITEALAELARLAALPLPLLFP